jgi:hypothetical protein
VSKNYTQSTASLQAVTVDTHILDANKILVYPGTGERSERTNILEIIKNNVPEDLEARIETIEDIVSGNYAPADFTTNTSGKSNETEGIAIQYSKKHFLPENSMIQSVSLPYTDAVSDLTNQYCHLYYYNAAGTVITTHISEDKQSRTKDTTGVSTWTFSEDCIIPAGYSYVRVCMSSSESPVSFGSTSKYRINVVNINGVTFDDDECCTWRNTSGYDNYLGDISVVYGELTGNITEQLRDINDKIEYLESNSGTDFAKKGEANTFTATNTFNGSTTFNGSSRFQTGPYDITINQSGLWSYYPVTSEMGFVTEGALSVAPLGVTTALGADAYALKVSKTEGIQLWGTHFMQGDEWSDNALKIVHNELALFGNHQAPCSLTFDNANVVNFRVMPDDGSTANGGQGAIFDFQGWQWDNDSHTSKNANCPVQILKNNAGSLTERSLLNKAELDKNYIIANDDNKHIVDTLNETISADNNYATGWINLETNTSTWSFWIDTYGPYQMLKTNPLAQDWCDLINAQNIPYEAAPHETDNTIFYIKAKNPGSTYCVPFGLGPAIGKRDETQTIYSGLTLSHENINLKKIDFLSEAQTRFAQRDTDNTFSANNTFKSGLTSESDILISNGVLTFEDLVDGTVVERSGASGYQYVEGMPTSFENGVCYDIGEISNTTNLTNVKFTGEGRLVQTCELWFTTPATVPTTHKWPTNIYWIDSATGAAPTLIASKNYRIVFRQEPNKIIASIAYLY